MRVLGCLIRVRERAGLTAKSLCNKGLEGA